MHPSLLESHIPGRLFVFHLCIPVLDRPPQPAHRGVDLPVGFTGTNGHADSLGSPGKVGLSVTNEGLMFSLAETGGNIWMARRRR